MRYVSVPREISSHDVRANHFSLSPGMYRRVHIPNPNTKTVRDLLNSSRPYDKGTEPGSFFYMKQSPYGFIRTKALQAHSTLLYPKGESIVPLNPRGVSDWAKFDLHDGDLLMAKDSNVGECVMVDGDGWNQHAWSNGIVRLHPTGDRFYFFAWIKHPIFKEQLLSVLPRGATILHAKDLWLDCVIPFPSQPDAERVVQYVSALMQAIVDKEKAVRERHTEIMAAIEAELENQNGTAFAYQYPTSHEIRLSTRLDTGLYCNTFKEFKHRITNYRHGATTFEAMGVRSRRGPNLAVSVIGKSLYAEVEKGGWYELIRPANISEYGTLTEREWLGNRKNLSLAQQGEIIFGCEATWRSLVLCDPITRCTTNFHGTVLHWQGAPLHAVVWLRCYLELLRERGILRYIAVGGQGGHLSPEYFEYIPVPKFPDEIQAEIAQRYHNPNAAPPADALTLETFTQWHNIWNQTLGIWELDREMKALQTTLHAVQDQIIRGETVQIPFPLTE